MSSSFEEAVDELGHRMEEIIAQENPLTIGKKKGRTVAKRVS